VIKIPYISWNEAERFKNLMDAINHIHAKLYDINAMALGLKDCINNFEDVKKDLINIEKDLTALKMDIIGNIYFKWEIEREG